MSKKIKDKRKNEITLTMLQLIATDGLQGASTVSIAKNLGISQGLVHYHFKNKLEIVISVIDMLSSMLMNRYNQLSEDCLSPLDKLNAFIDARLAKGNGDNSQAVAVWVVIAAEAVKEPVIKEKYSNAIKAQMVLVNGIMSEMPKYENPEERLYKIGTLMAFMEGAFSLSITADKVVPHGYAAKMARNILAMQY